MMVDLYMKKENCCGCTACENICPHQAISMKADTEGFLYPNINTEKCTECQLCISVCPLKNKSKNLDNLKIAAVYAVKHKDLDIRMTSSSGGAFTAISDFILENNGIVFGAAFNEEFEVVHQRASSKKERENLKGSKYVQSNLIDIFKEIEDTLKSNQYTLFTGTPCQTAGLNMYLVKKNITNFDKLFLCDLVCHGTPSPLMWKEHIELLERKEKSRIVEYHCRSKVEGWHAHNELCVYENGKKDYRSLLSQKHKNLFYSHNILRPSCYDCQYTNIKRPSDITIGDYWGIEKCIPDFDDNKGISLVLINTYKGQKLFENLKTHVHYRKSNFQDCMQPQLEHPVIKSPKRDIFWKDYYEYGYEHILRKYIDYGVKGNFKIFVKKILNKLGLLGLARQLRS
ncbi:MAG: Coenzyme F420 hydrogenase/dehydrogenase, beta subunit C-terminal domain [Eubacterium sp.]